MPQLTVTISESAYCGFIEFANRNSTTAENLASAAAQSQGKAYANALGIGVVTSGAIIAKFTPSEYEAILNASQQHSEVKGLIDELVSEGRIDRDDPRLTNGFDRLVALGLLAADRPAEILSYLLPQSQPPA